MGAGDKLDAGFAGNTPKQRALQIGAMDSEIGRLPAPLGRRPKRHARQFGKTRRIAQDNCLGPDGGREQRLEYAEAIENPRCIRRELDAGARLLKPRTRSKTRTG